MRKRGLSPGIGCRMHERPLHVNQAWRLLRCRIEVRWADSWRAAGSWAAHSSCAPSGGSARGSYRLASSFCGRHLRRAGGGDHLADDARNPVAPNVDLKRGGGDKAGFDQHSPQRPPRPGVPVSPSATTWLGNARRDAGAVERGGLENRCARVLKQAKNLLTIYSESRKTRDLMG